MPVDQRRAWADAVFVEPPPQWGLRGDPFLWQELHERLLERPAPASVDELLQLLRDELAALCGTDLIGSRERALRVERYPDGGLSGGHVSPQAWREELLPLLAARFAG